MKTLQPVSVCPPAIAQFNVPSVARLLLVDDHPVYRHGLAQLLAQEPDLEVAGEVGDSQAALAAVRELTPDAVVVDLSMPMTNGVQWVRELRGAGEEVPVVMLSMHDTSHHAVGALQAGAGAYVIKHEPFELILAAVRAVLKGERYLSPRFRDQLAFRNFVSKPGGGVAVDRLSERELEVLRFLGAGFSTREIASTLSLSAKTVETHRAHIKDKLRLRDSAEMVRFAIDWLGQQQL